MVMASEEEATAAIKQLTAGGELSRQAAGRQVWAAWYSVAGCRDSPPHYRQPRLPGLTSPQRIPRIIWQLTSTAAAALERDGHAISTWWKKNPTYAYNLLDDEDCNRLVAGLASTAELAAYELVKTGVQRADLARVLVLREIGGVYADTDVTATRPLTTVLPATATMVVLGGGSVFEVMMSAPGNPLLSAHLVAARSAIEAQASFACSDSPPLGCHGYIACIHNVTGPHAYRRSAAAVSGQLQCRSLLARVYGRAPRDSEDADRISWPCNESSNSSMQGLYVLPVRFFPTQHKTCHRQCATRLNASSRHYSLRHPAVSVWSMGVIDRRVLAGISSATARTSSSLSRLR